MTPSKAPEVGSLEIRSLDMDDIAEASELLARGFAEEPGNRALLPDPETRHRLVVVATTVTLRETIPLGTAHGAVVDGSLAAVAIWHPPGWRPAPLRTLRRTAVGKLAQAPSLARSVLPATLVVGRQAHEAIRFVGRRRRAVASASTGRCWHLAFLATAPQHRGAGLARGLLDRQLLRCDQDGAAIWLETTDPVNPPIYERFGFETVTHIEDAAWLPGLWVMRREPMNGKRGA